MKIKILYALIFCALKMMGMADNAQREMLSRLFFKYGVKELSSEAVNLESKGKPINLGLYQHSKSGKFYEVLGVARYSENSHQQFVVYKQLYESILQPDGIKLPHGTIWVRPKEMFFEMVDNGQGVKVPRFKKVEQSKL